MDVAVNSGSNHVKSAIAMRDIAPESPTPQADSNRLPVLAAEIRRAHADVQDAAKTAAERAIDAGKALLEAKELVKHGEWLPWLRENCALAERTAQLYMQLAKKRVPPDAIASLGLSAAAATLEVIYCEYDPLAYCTDEAKRQWPLFILFLVQECSWYFEGAVLHTEWILGGIGRQAKQLWDTPGDWLSGEAARKVRSRWGMRQPNKAIVEAWDALSAGKWAPDRRRRAESTRRLRPGARPHAFAERFWPPQTQIRNRCGCGEGAMTERSHPLVARDLVTEAPSLGTPTAFVNMPCSIFPKRRKRKPKPRVDSDLFTSEEAAAYLRVSAKTLHRLPIPYIIFGQGRVKAHRAYHRGDLDHFIEAHAKRQSHVRVQTQRLAALPLRLPSATSSLFRLYGMHKRARSQSGREGREGQGQGAVAQARAGQCRALDA
jgi:hypothetical protein